MISRKAQLVLQKMVAAYDAEEYFDSELVRQGRQAWLADMQVPSKVVDELLRRCLIKDDSDGGEQGFERYIINEDSRKAAIDPNWIRPELAAVLCGTPNSAGNQQ